MAEDCWGPDYTGGSTEPDEWDTEAGYNAFHSRYRIATGGTDIWICKKCGCAVGDTELHDKTHSSGR